MRNCIYAIIITQVLVIAYLVISPWPPLIVAEILVLAYLIRDIIGRDGEDDQL